MMCPDEYEERYFIVDIENDRGVTGCIGLSKDIYDEEEHEELTYMILRIVDVWLKRREFIHANIERYEVLS